MNTSSKYDIILQRPDGRIDDQRALTRGVPREQWRFPKGRYNIM